MTWNMSGGSFGKAVTIIENKRVLEVNKYKCNKE